MEISATVTKGMARKSIDSKGKWIDLRYLADVYRKILLLILQLQELSMRADSKPPLFAMSRSFY